MDRSESFSNQGGPLFSEIKSALYEVENKPFVKNYIFGLGGREINTAMIESIFQDLGNIVKENKIEEKVSYLGVR